MKTYKNDKGIKVEQKVNAHLHTVYENSPDRSRNTVNIKIETGVLGNKQGEVKTGSAGKRSAKSIATGSSLMTGLKSSYVTGKWTIPFDMEYVEDHFSDIAPIMASIQNKLSGILREAQGKVDGPMAKKLRDTAIRTEAIQIAREKLESRTNQQFVQDVFDGANASVRANVLTDMSMMAMVETNFSISTEDDIKADWAKQKGYRITNDGEFMVLHSKEKGLKKVYLYNANLVKSAQDKVDEICGKIESKLGDVKKFQTLGSDNSLAILQIFDNALDYEPSTIEDILFNEFSSEEIDTINKYVLEIMANYESTMGTL